MVVLSSLREAAGVDHNRAVGGMVRGASAFVHIPVRNQGWPSNQFKKTSLSDLLLSDLSRNAFQSGSWSLLPLRPL